MLDSGTKRRIDTARDILVGKVPDPKSQVEQITIALIYKFMNDMDAQAEEMGGKRRFFAGDFEKYGWSKLMAVGMGGHEVLNLYAEAIAKMNEHVNIPLLFREIFKNAYLPYRDPETLKSFLKVINDFEYDHSERLGDAFEYLLSVLGSQGEAGQFRTPRHIIDFMVAVIDPKKNETILDPACGTAGFLISAYKHVLKENSSNYGKGKDPYAFELHGVKLEELTADTGKKYKGDKLTPDERNRLINNICGYDISPDMVRLSLVNLYLHGFPDPHIYEYDTLTSEDRWNEYYDIILANPPFMSPKGGIRPHKRFTVNSSRSEVLFVDYMAEHLAPNGRCAVVVPEGVIFQTGTAYKSLRKMLVDENHLVGVISLPAGVFNPYSGVKTSILWLDKSLARKTDRILFVKIENDGFDLGAQRRPIKQNDLPAAFQKILWYKEALLNGKEIEFEDDRNLNIVKKTILAESRDYNLTGDRYRKSLIEKHSKFEFVPIGEICDLVGGGTPSKQDKSFWENGSIKWISSKHINDNGQVTDYELITEEAIKNSSTKIVPKGSTIVITRVSVGKVAYADDDYAVNQDLTGLKIKNISKIDEKYLFYSSLVLGPIINKNAQGLGVRGINRDFLSSLAIPLPPLSVQQEIVAEIESYQKIIDGASQVVENYKPRIDIDPEWPMVKLNDMCLQMSNGVNFGKEQVGSGIKFINIKDLFSDGFVEVNGLDRVQLNDKEISRNQVLKDDLLFVRSSVKYEGVGFPSLFKPIDEEPVVFCGFIIKATLNKTIINPRFVLFLLRTESYRNKVIALSNKANITNISQDNLKSLEIPLPDLETQQQIAAQIEREQELVKANKQLIEIYERKIKDRIAKVWGE